MPIRLVTFFIVPLFCQVAFAQNDLTEIPEPDPVAEAAAMIVHEGAIVNLFASDPDIAKPIQMNFDSTGGLWIASSKIYPQIQPGEVADDKIIVLRDTDGDGASDSWTVFADGLLIPTGVLPDGPHAAYVADSTQLLYLEDTDHDGRSDTRRVVLSGFGTEDTHHLVHTLRYGPDGCVYFNQSIYIHSHFDTPDGTRHLDGGGIWRYRPSTDELEIFAKGFINPWGHSFDRAGESFVTDGAYFEGINYAFPDSVFVTSPGATRWLSGMNPGSPKHCGLEILSGTHVPPEWLGSFVTSDYRSHRVCRFSVKPSASGYLSRQQPEIITSPHVAFRPIDARMGPDGALYIADWYNPIIQHGEVDFRDERRDRTHGRIWRVSFPDRAPDAWPEFAEASISELLKMLEDPSLAVAQFARQEMWNRLGDRPGNVLDELRAWTAKKPSTRTNELLWMNEVVASPTTQDLANAMESFDAIEQSRQRTCLRSLWRNRVRFSDGSSERTQIEQFALSQSAHANPNVRLEAVVCAGQLAGADALNAVLAATALPIDGNLDFAIWQSIRSLEQKQSTEKSQRSLLADINWNDRADELARVVSAVATPAAAETAVKWIESSSSDTTGITSLVDAVSIAGDAGQLGRLVKSLLIDKKVRSLDAIRPLVDRTKRDKTIPERVHEVLPALVQSPNELIGSPDWANAVAEMASAWKVDELENVIVQSISVAIDPGQKDQLIASLGSFDTATAKEQIDQLASSTDRGTRVAATRAIAGLRPRAAIQPIIAMLGDTSTADAATDLVIGMIARKDVVDNLAAAIDKTNLETDVARKLLRRVRSAGGSASLEAAITKSGKLDGVAWKLTPELARSIALKAAQDGSPARGEVIYRRESLQCINCHAIGTAGGLVGPNLISIGGSSQLDYIIESLLDPSAKLKEGYTTLSLLTDDGQLVNGIVIGKTDEAIRLRLADGKEVQIDVDTIEQEKPGKSLMPVGLIDSLTEGELVDLVAFLSALGRMPEYTVSTDPIVRSMQTLVYSNEANRQLNRTSTDTVATDHPDMKWREVTTTVDGMIPLIELDRFQQHRETPPMTFVRFPIRMPAEGNIQLSVPEEGIDAWVDGKPTPIWNLKSMTLDAGTHQLVIGIDRSKLTEPFAVQVEGDAAP